MNRCPTCNAPLPWPGIPLTAWEQDFLSVIKKEQVSRNKQMIRLMKDNNISEVTFRHRFNKLQAKLKPLGLKILPRPYRLVQIQEVGIQLPIIKNNASTAF